MGAQPQPDEWGEIIVRAAGSRPSIHKPTPPELDVIRCFSHGLEADLAAAALGIDTDAVETRLQLARVKLAAKNTTHAVARAIRLGLIL